jgi:hypothetical protein
MKLSPLWNPVVATSSGRTKVQIFLPASKNVRLGFLAGFSLGDIHTKLQKSSKTMKVGVVYRDLSEAILIDMR